jgi:ABC-2 type transport system ATP-binding protein
MQVCVGLLSASAGRVNVLGGSARDREIRRRIGYLPEESTLHGFLTARETILFHAGLCELPRACAVTRADYLLDLVELTDARDRHVREFSKGMARRLCLAQTLVGDPELLVLDEPTTGLDPLGTRMVKDLLLKLKRLGRTVLLSSHLLGEVEEVADALTILEGGRVLASGRTEDLLAAERQEITTSPLSPVKLARLRGFLSNVGTSSFSVRRGRRSLEELFLTAVREGPE